MGIMACSHCLGPEQGPGPGTGNWEMGMQPNESLSNVRHLTFLHLSPHHLMCI